MNEYLRKSLPARGTALGFIALVLFGNLWVGYALINATPPNWVRYGFGFGMVTAIAFGLALGGLAIYRRLFPVEAPADDE